MIVNVNKISEKGYALNDTLDIDNAQLLEEGSGFLEGVEFQLFFKRQDRRIQAQGKIKTVISLDCVRCLEPFELRINSHFDIILFPKELIDTRSTALEEEDLEYIFYENDQIDVEKILVEQVNLFIPFKPVCKNECKGICPGCGANLNMGACPCDQAKNEIKFLFEKVKR
ncbi:MAG: DUF177 domain-containing protein [Acidobacteria bacterium]|jgi:uncharacterized protein|nr:DUF177 domain-containing protein [Acidobacteriota bacterium]